mgnify:CR=1 FL=1
MSGGWIGVDFDGTLAEYGSWNGPLSIGTPVPAMVARVRAWLAAGCEVRIVTARANDPDPAGRSQAILAIERWCERQFGQLLRVTARKDYAMMELWDDRAVQVEPNTGQPALVIQLQAILDDLPVVAGEKTPEQLLLAIRATIDVRLRVAKDRYE